jgi:prepilin-type N-terminal cleavage/methylation domain-containing protein
MRGATRHIERGMTLLELLVALAIFAIIGGALYPVISGTLSSRAAATSRYGIDAEARRILDRLEQDIAGNLDVGLQGPVPPRFLAPIATGAGSERTILEMTTLVTRGVTPADGFVGGEDVAALSVDRGDQAHVLWRVDSAGRLLRQEVRPPRIDPVDWTQVPVEVMSERAAVVLEYYEPPAWNESWDSTESGPHRGKSPSAVRTTLTIDDGGDRPFEIVSTAVVPQVETFLDPNRQGARP